MNVLCQRRRLVSSTWRVVIFRYRNTYRARQRPSHQQASSEVEQMAHNHCVDGSNPSLATTYEVVTGKPERVGVRLPL